MGQFTIYGTWMAGVMHSIKGSSMNFVTQLILAPLAMTLRRINDWKVRKNIF
jgi:hypothetical protein